MLSGPVASTGADLEPHPSFAQFLLELEMPASTGESGFLPITPVPLTSSVNMRRGTEYPRLVVTVRLLIMILW